MAQPDRNLSSRNVLNLCIAACLRREAVCRQALETVEHRKQRKEIPAMKTRMGIVLAACTLGLGPLYAQTPPPQPPMRRPDARFSIQEVLDLTERQLSELNGMREEHMEKVRELNSKLRDLERQRREQMQSTSPNAVEIGSLALQVQSLQQQIEEENRAYRENGLRVLDSGQREKIEKIEEALKLAPQAGALASYGLLDMQALGRGGQPGMMGAAFGWRMMGAEPVPGPAPPQQ
jgi:hypothetical protein